MIDELGERVERCFYEENIGSFYQRTKSIKFRVLEGHMTEALNPPPRCSFSNQYGMCIESTGHTGSHRCVFLGDD